MKLFVFCLLKNTIFLDKLVSKIQPWSSHFEKERCISIYPISLVNLLLTLYIKVLPTTLLQRSISMSPLVSVLYLVFCFLLSTLAISIVETPIRWVVFRFVEWHNHHKTEENSNKIID